VEGQAVVMSCELSKPWPVMWLKDGIELKPDDHCEVVADGCIHRLSFHRTTLQDQAEYTVKLSYAVFTTAALWVKGMIHMIGASAVT